jgi:integrase
MALTDAGIRTLVPQEKAYRKADGRGLFLLVTPSGGKSWRYRYQFQGHAQQLVIGPYPEIGLAAARAERDKAIVQVAQGINPALEKKQRKLAEKKAEADVENTFAKVAREWWENQKGDWSENHAQLVWRRLEMNILPYIGSRPIIEIEPPDLLQQLRRIEARGALESARRILQILGQIFRYGVAAGYCQRNQAADLQGALAKPKKRQWPAILDKDGIRSLLQSIDDYVGSPVTRAALRFAALTFQRPGEIRNAQWHEINFEDAIWEIPAERMKMKRPHLVPLSRQALEVLVDLYPLTGPDGHIFPGEGRARAMSENTLNYALRRMGIPKEAMVSHGFRTIASTTLHECGLFNSAAIEMQLSHIDKNAIRAAYNRAIFMDERRRLMQWYADRLDAIRDGGKVLPFTKAANE